MAIKKLQNNFTTPEQSKRLLELGVPADSADCFYSSYTSLKGDTQLYRRPRIITEDNGDINWGTMVYDGSRPAYLPCWSVGRIVEIMALCYKFDFPDAGSVQIYTTDIKKGTVVYFLISDIERFINKFDFSKLEE